MSVFIAGAMLCMASLILCIYVAEPFLAYMSYRCHLVDDHTAVKPVKQLSDGQMASIRSAEIHGQHLSGLSARYEEFTGSSPPPDFHLLVLKCIYETYEGHKSPNFKVHRLVVEVLERHRQASRNSAATPTGAAEQIPIDPVDAWLTEPDE